MDFAHHRQLFLTEQGYSYEILDESDVAGAAPRTRRRPSPIGTSRRRAGVDPTTGPDLARSGLHPAASRIGPRESDR